MSTEKEVESVPKEGNVPAVYDACRDKDPSMLLLFTLPFTSLLLSTLASPEQVK